MKQVYLFDPATLVYLGVYEAQKSPLDPDEFLIPVCATDLEPPKTAKNEVCIFIDGQWQIFADWRGVALISITDGTSVVITEVGQTPADVGATDVAQPSPMHSWQAVGWVIDAVKVAAQLDAAKATGLIRISDYAKSKRALIAGTSDDAEIAGWNNKLRIALACRAGSSTVADLVAMQAEIDARGLNETMDVFIGKVLANAAFYAQAVGLIDGHKRRAQDAVSAADSPEAVEAVLMQMREQAETAFANLMATAV